MSSLKRKNSNPVKSKPKKQKINSSSEMPFDFSSQPWSKEISSDSVTKYFNEFSEKGILEKIFKMVDSRRNLASVSKLFYSTVCKIDNGERIYRAYLNEHTADFKDPNNIFSSVFHSQRKFQEVEFDKLNFVDKKSDRIHLVRKKTFLMLNEVLKKMAQTLTVLTFRECQLSDDQLMYLLKSLSGGKLRKLKMLECTLFKQSTNSFPSTLTLPKLREINFNGTQYTEDLNKSVINGDGTLAAFLEMIENYGKLISFTANVSITSLISLNLLQLSKLAVKQANPRNIRLSSVISAQRNLTMLDVSDCFLMEDVLLEIVKLNSLCELKINIQGLTMKGFGYLTYMPSLVALYVTCNHSSWITNILPLCRFKYLSQLYINMEHVNVSVQTLIYMLNIKLLDLHIVTSNNYAVNCIFATQYSQNLERVTVEISSSSSSKKKGLLMMGFNSHPNLKEFTVINKDLNLTDSLSNLSHIFARIPNIEKLHIEGFRIEKILHAVAIKHHYSLRELTLIGHSKIENNYIFDDSISGTIEEYGANLKSMLINCLNCVYNNPRKFPVNWRKENMQILRYR